ncbi:[FeFe] hydrogenase H-cluster maturation GTPase HydF [candidate division WOR-3 bacterium]|nr:[FeFe] hydrogenase H-cluster maturation GTPase HydF [candidate division WOR-3 bacterium]
MKSRTIRGDRLHIGIFGKRNAGKSSLINALSGQSTAIVSDVPGTTTDPVFKSMELSPLGPVVLIDTAGIDDAQEGLGKLRKERTQNILEKTDFAVLIVESASVDFDFEDKLIENFEKEGIPYIIALNKTDLKYTKETEKWLKGKAFIGLVSTEGKGISELKNRIIQTAPTEWERPFLSDLIHPQDIVLLVTPIDLGAPKGRLIMPQIKALRDILDSDAIPMMCKERELPSALAKLREKPALVVTDSQVFPQVAADVPSDILLTSFSILSIRQKGDLRQMVEGVLSVKNLKTGDKILIAEACSHHPLEDDIGRVKIPRWLNSQVGGGLDIKTFPGSEYPSNLEEYKLVVHCGACTLNRKEMLKRQEKALSAGVSITNYGVLISYLKSVFPRALKPFPQIYSMFDKKTSSPGFDIRKKMAKFAEL